MSGDGFMGRFLSAGVKRIHAFLCVVITVVICLSALFFFKVFCHGKVVNEAILRRNLNKGFILASNHVSYMDWLVLFGYFLFYRHIHIVFIAKDKLFYHPLWKYVVKGGQGVRVSNCGTKFLSHKDYKRLVEAKYVGIFPEATRSAKGNLITVHGGAIKIAAKKGLPLIPIRLEGFYHVLPRGQKIPVPYPCRIIIGQECFYFPEEVENTSDSSLNNCMFRLLENLEYVALNEQYAAISTKEGIDSQKCH